MTMQEDRPSWSGMPAVPEVSPPRFILTVPASWPHAGGPLHGLLEFQGARCAICGKDATWSDGTGEPKAKTNAGAETQADLEPGIAASSMKQWVDDETGLLLGLVCARCCRRYKTLGGEPEGAALAELPAFLNNPPGQRCKDTIGLGRQTRPRRLDSKIDDTETADPEKWRYYGTVVHSLFLWQRGRCAICSTGLPVATRPKTVHVDHDDESGLIRGLLCQRDNIALGQTTWPREWWEHLAPMVDAYLDHPPAQSCPATRGLRMSQRNRGAEITSSTDHQEVLMDGLPMSINRPAASRQTPAPDGKWFALRYNSTAPLGYPPVVEAAQALTYSDEEGSWYGFTRNPYQEPSSSE